MSDLILAVLMLLGTSAARLTDPNYQIVKEI